MMDASKAGDNSSSFRSSDLSSQDTNHPLFDGVVGVLGGGQLGRMMAEAASCLAVDVAVLDPSEHPSAAYVTPSHQQGSFRDAEAVTTFAKSADVLTVEIEHVDVEALRQAQESTGIPVHPLPETIAVVQDKFRQKEHFHARGIPVAEFIEVKGMQSVEEAQLRFGFPLILKRKKLAYDGRGNAVVSSAEEIEDAIERLGGTESNELYIEKAIDFVAELAVVVARSRCGTQKNVFPVVETVHKDSICHTVVTPPSASHSICQAAERLAMQTIDTLEGAGVFAVEMFQLSDGSLLVNEVAPRPHNSGHLTIEACYVSQFEQHIRAVTGLPLGCPDLKVPAAAMLNILGTEDGLTEAQLLLERALNTPGASVHWYSKGEVRLQRKVGHITITGDSRETVISKLNAIETGESSSIQTNEPPAVGIIMGSDSDLPIMKAAEDILKDLGIACEITIVSAHRTPDRMVHYARTAASRGVRCIIAGAGGAAHLPGMVAALTPLPVIGVPCYKEGGPLQGMDALLSIVQMPKGIPVASVAIGNAANAGLLAARIIGSANPQVLSRMEQYQENMRDIVLAKIDKMPSAYDEYLKSLEP